MNKSIKPDCSGAQNYLSWGQRIALGLIRGYQLTLSPWIGRQCRFYPTCSHYADEAIKRHGVTKGLQLTAVRLAKCQPFHPGGVDLVPVENPSPETQLSAPSQSPII